MFYYKIQTFYIGLNASHDPQLLLAYLFLFIHNHLTHKTSCNCFFFSMSKNSLKHHVVEQVIFSSWNLYLNFFNDWFILKYLLVNNVAIWKLMITKIHQIGLWYTMCLVLFKRGRSFFSSTTLGNRGYHSWWKEKAYTQPNQLNFRLQTSKPLEL